MRVAIDDWQVRSYRYSQTSHQTKLNYRKITTGIHESGHRQAITEAVLGCQLYGNSLVVEGVETIDEWLWLQHAGVQRFQGFLFAAKLNGVSGIDFSFDGASS